jgi:hypothetical protein
MKCVPSKALREFQVPPSPGSATQAVNKIDPAKISRSIEEGLDYLPWWRSLLSNVYLHEFQERSKSGQEFAFPTSEKDQLVLNYFMFKAYGVCSDSRMTRALQWCEKGHMFSQKNMAKVRAMVVAGCSDDDIAAKFFTSPAYIAIYVKLFFDIRDCLASPTWMDTFIKPETPDVISSKDDLEEVIWLSFGFHKGPVLLDLMLSGKMAYLSPDESDEFWQVARSAVTAQGVTHALGNLIENICGRSTEWERSLSIRNAENEKLLKEQDLPSTGSWGDWMNEAMDAGIFAPEIQAGIKGGERAFLELTRMTAVSSPSGEKKLTASRMLVSKRLFS